MTLEKLSFILAIITAGLLIATADHRNILKVRKIECVTSDAYAEHLKNFTCSIKAINRFRATINAHVYLMKPFNDVLVNLQIYKKNSFRYLPFMVNVTTNICTFLNGTSNNSFYVRFMVGWIRNYSNLNHSCPYEGILFAKDLEPFADKIPVFAPAGDYRLDMKFYEYNFLNWIATIRGYGVITIKPLIDLQ